MKYDFKHKVVVITGATGGIGRALAWRFAKAGARLALLDLNEEQLSALQVQLEPRGAEVISRVCDITDAERCEEIMREVEEHFGGIDVLINNAGVAQYSLFTKTDVEVTRRVMEVNFFGSLNCTKAALPSLTERKGMIITLSSVLGLMPSPCVSSYSASKHALHGLFDSLRPELVEQGVHVMMACPGKTDTEINKRVLAGDGSIVEIERPDVMATPADVADAIFESAQKKKRMMVYTNISPFARFMYKYFPAYYEYKALKPLRKKLRAAQS